MKDQITMQELIELDTTTRKYVFSKSFILFIIFYFTEFFKYPFAQFHKDFIASLEARENIFFEGFRESAKTTITRMYVIRTICFKKSNYIMWY